MANVSHTDLINGFGDAGINLEVKEINGDKVILEGPFVPMVRMTVIIINGRISIKLRGLDDLVIDDAYLATRLRRNFAIIGEMLEKQ